MTIKQVARGRNLGTPPDTYTNKVCVDFDSMHSGKASNNRVCLKLGIGVLKTPNRLQQKVTGEHSASLTCSLMTVHDVHTCMLGEADHKGPD